MFGFLSKKNKNLIQKNLEFLLTSISKSVFVYCQMGHKNNLYFTIFVTYYYNYFFYCFIETILKQVQFVLAHHQL